MWKRYTVRTAFMMAVLQELFVLAMVPLLLVWLACLLGVASLVRLVAEHHMYGTHTTGQIALAVSMCVLFSAWVVAELQALTARYLSRRSTPVSAQSTDEEAQNIKTDGDMTCNTATVPAASVVGQSSEKTGNVAGTSKAAVTSIEPSAGLVLRFLRVCAELAVILLFIYLCDRTEFFSKSKKVYNPTQFWVVWGLICLAAFCTVRQLTSEKALQRDQTDEWKGWMQIMFLMYHYFAEKEIYNAIRIYIAAYVWMTGYGNFYLYVRKPGSFSTARLVHMLFRLNFLGFCMCVLMNNEYMLYYICAMHTLFTIFVMVALYIWQDLNSSRWGIYMKIFTLLVVTVVLYDGPDVIFTAVFGTLPVVRPLMAFHDPLHPEFKDEMHEWHFRSGLDRFVWIFGMIFALHIDDLNTWLERVGSLKPMRQFIAYLAIGGLALLAGAIWWYHVFTLNKLEYNRLHPYTSFMPIAIFLLLRNLVPAMRKRHLWLFSFMGKYTLETYILQFHIWMRTTGVNGSPKHLLVFVPGSYWVNFAVVTTVYIWLSMRVFNLTADLSEMLFRKDPRDIAISVVCMVSYGFVCYAVAELFFTT
mmetsp:Transcript_103054/g.204578  ORF Transcript_103054/g.204578 Transcript_103054/m.204578 type:complete len:586 (+) Transcript_103054:131-1888(+)